MFDNVYKNKKVVITGNTGFKGSWLTIWLLKLGAQVYGIAKDIPTQPSMFKELGLSNKVDHKEKDVRDLSSVSKIIKEIKPDFLFHLAAQPLVSISYREPIETISTNVMGTANILEVLKESNHACTGIIITSDKCYENVEWEWGFKETDPFGDKGIYGGSKGAAELIFKSYYHSYFKSDKSNVKVATTRAGNVIGGGDWAQDRIVPDCVRAWTKGLPVEIRNPESTRPWQHVLEPLSGYLLLGQQLSEGKNLNGESFNFGPPPQFSRNVKEILEDLSKYWNFTDFSQAYRIIRDIKFHEAGLLKLNCDKAFYHLKWLPVLSYKKLIEFTSTWYLNFYRGKTDMLDFTLSQIKEFEQIALEKKMPWTT